MKHRPIVTCAFLLVLIGLSLGCSKNDPQPGAAPAPELLANVSMEDGTTSPVNWLNASNNPYNTNYLFDWSQESASSGSHSLKITSSIMNGPNEGWWSQYVTSSVQAGKTVQLTVKIKGVNLTKGIEGVGVLIRIAAFAGATQTQYVTSYGVNDITGSFDYTTYSVKLANLGAGTTTLGVYLTLGPQTTGVVYFDDVSLKVLE